jgi:NAD(P)-dependent dehydrogenase (short-subunit alcohol dehydrogenase family)
MGEEPKMSSLKQIFDLTGRVALITGGSRGLGLQIAEALGEYGARVALAARKSGELDEAVAHLAGLGIDAFAVPADLRDAEAADRLAGTVMERAGRIDILVNNAGATWGAKAEDHTPEAWRRVMGLNVDSLFYLCQSVGRAWMIPQRNGRIINVASIAGLKGNAGTIAYNTSKGAVVNFTRALAAEWGPLGITVNALAPGWFPSRMTAATLERSGPEFATRAPLRKLGGPDDLKGAALLFASDAGGHITGQTLAIDGGVSAI